MLTINKNSSYLYILFGSTWLFMGMSIKQLADEVMKLPLKEEVKEKWLYHNATQLFCIK
ncbi:MAG: hypothetical protein ACFFFB_12670 [Candidatus Heimdallarchaeota archaeon]